MKIKKEFDKANWPGMLVTIIVALAAIYNLDLVMGIVALVFAAVLVSIYSKYDVEVQEMNDWWSKLDKKQKEKLYRNPPKGEESKDEP